MKTKKIKKGRHWSSAEEALLKDIYSEKNNKEIGVIFSRDSDAIKRKAHLTGLNKRGTLENKLECKQKTITTIENLEKFGYIRRGKSNNLQVWILGEHQKEIQQRYEEKYGEELKQRKHEYNKKYEEVNKIRISERKKIYYQENREKIDKRNLVWKQNNPDKCRKYFRKYYANHKKESYDKNREWILAHPDKRREYGKKTYRSHRIERIKKVKTYQSNHRNERMVYIQEYYLKNKEHIKRKAILHSKTPKGRLAARKANARHREKGFILLTDILDIPFDWHHIHTNLPFVIAVNRKIHRITTGGDHYNQVNTDSGYDDFVDMNSEFTSKEFVEAKVEILYPEQFKQYWFGDY